MVNRSNANHAIEQLNNRIDGVVESMGGVDVVFKKTDKTLTNIADTAFGDYSLGWSYANAGKLVIYEAQVPAPRISNLRPAGMWKCRVVEDGTDAFIADTYRQLKHFTVNSDGTVSFAPALQAPATSAGNGAAAPIDDGATVNFENHGGNLLSLLAELIDFKSNDEADVMAAIKTEIEDNGTFNVNNLYYLQLEDLVATEIAKNSSYTDSYTLHFE